MTVNETELKNLIIRAEVLGKKNWLHAVNILEKATDDYPRERAIYLTLGDIYMRHRKFEQAIDSYQKAMTIDPKDEHLHFIIGNCYLSLSDYKMALYYYDQVSSNLPELLYNKALAHAYNGDHELSLHYIKILIKDVKDNANIYYFLVEENLRLHKYNDSLTILNEMEKRFGVQRYEQILKGFVWNFKKVWLKSYMAFKTADEMSPIVNQDHLHTYAMAAKEIGQLTKAVELLKRAVAINPHVSIIHEDLIRFIIELGDIPSAHLALNQAWKYLGKSNPILQILSDKLDRLKEQKTASNIPTENDEE